MTQTDLLNDLKEFTELITKDVILPTRIQKEDEEPGLRAPDVYLMRITDARSAEKKAPYILHQLITSKDKQAPNQRMTSQAQIRSIVCVYSRNDEEGGLMLVELMERMRIAILEAIAIGHQFTLDRDEGVEILYYPDDTAPYFVGEMLTTWNMPNIERKLV
ncbi:MAG: hypothetical protein LUD25_02475 [Coriobacteriaceae bacterium]|nr:hypothetical protein [Coriobacteriaceae bacterium]